MHTSYEWQGLIYTHNRICYSYVSYILYNIHEKPYKFLVCEFGGVLRDDACVPAIPIHRESTDSLIYNTQPTHKILSHVL